jgi:hypothetical protein
LSINPSDNLKKLAAIGLLILLLYNTFGLSFAILFFEKDYKIASASRAGDEYRVMKLFLPSLPYSRDWEKTEGLEGLVKKDGDFYNTTHVLHENDTLYVTLKSNQAARDHFFELANAMQILSDPQKETPQNPYGKAINLLSDFVKHYVQRSQAFAFESRFCLSESAYTVETPYKSILYSFKIRLHTPPPELS